MAYTEHFGFQVPISGIGFLSVKSGIVLSPIPNIIYLILGYLIVCNHKSKNTILLQI
jgi:hypothetical protein